MRRRAARALGVIAVLAAVVAPTRVAADDLKDDLQRVTDRIRSVAEQIDDVGEERSRLAAEIRAAGGRLERLLTDVTTAEAGLVGAQSDMNAATVRLNAIQARLHDSYSHLYATRISIADTRSAAIESARNAYLSGDSEISVLAISAERLTEVSIALEYLARASGTTGEALATLVLLETREQDQQVMMREQETAMDADLVAMKALQADMEEARDGLNLERGRVEEAIAGLESLLTELDLELAEFEHELDGLETEQVRIKRKIAEEQAKKVAPISAAGFFRPVPGVVTSTFGPRQHPILGYFRMHTGVDMSSGYGQPIRASKDGVVILAGTWGGYGRTVVIDHGGGLSTLYAHQSVLSVAYGETVSAGQVIGKVGTSGLATGAHLHFEVRRGGEPVNRAPYLAG